MKKRKSEWSLWFLIQSRINSICTVGILVSIQWMNFKDLRISCDIQVTKIAQGNMAVEVTQNFYLDPNIYYSMFSFSRRIYVCC